MLLFALVPHYLVWHYTAGWGRLIHLWRNYLWWTQRFFSLREMATSLFAPYHRMIEGRRDRFSFEDLAARIIINTLSRLIGAVLRLTIMATGFSVGVVVSLFFATVTVLWAFVPALLMILALYGVILMARL